jgi:hypothetical protein
MKGILSIVLLLGMLLVGYLVVKDLGLLSGSEEGDVTIAPLDRAGKTAVLIQRTQEELQEKLNKIER